MRDRRETFEVPEGEGEALVDSDDDPFVLNKPVAELRNPLRGGLGMASFPRRSQQQTMGRGSRRIRDSLVHLSLANLIAAPVPCLPRRGAGARLSTGPRSACGGRTGPTPSPSERSCACRAYRAGPTALLPATA